MELKEDFKILNGVREEEKSQTLSDEQLIAYKKILKDAYRYLIDLKPKTASILHRGEDFVKNEFDEKYLYLYLVDKNILNGFDNIRNRLALFVNPCRHASKHITQDIPKEFEFKTVHGKHYHNATLNSSYLETDLSHLFIARSIERLVEYDYDNRLPGVRYFMDIIGSCDDVIKEINENKMMSNYQYLDRRIGLFVRLYRKETYECIEDFPIRNLLYSAYLNRFENGYDILVKVIKKRLHNSNTIHSLFKPLKISSVITNRLKILNNIITERMENILKGVNVA